MMKKILYIGNFELPDKNPAAHRVLGNAKALRAAGNEVYLVGISNKKVKQDILTTKKDYQGFVTFSRNYPCGIKDWANYSWDITPYTSIMQAVGGVELVICYNFLAFPLLRMIRYCKKHSIYITADVTEWYSTEGRPLLVRIVKGFETFVRMRFIQRHLDGMIVISSFLKNYYSKCNSVIEIPPLVDLCEPKWWRRKKKRVH